jgi:thiol-disulfide isomerase/thioredoxin
MSASKQSGAAQQTFWTTPRIIFTCAVFCLFAAFGLSSCSSTNEVATSGNSNAPKPAAPVNRSTTAPANPAPAAPTPLPASVLNSELKDINGAPLKLSDYSGKVLVINMWATWCGPCRIETPELVTLSKDYKDRGVELVGLTTKQNDPSIDAIKDFLTANKVGYRTIYDDGTLASSLTQLTRARSVIPQSFVISREGHILTHFEGFDPNSTPAKLRAAVEQAINYKS